MTARTVSPLVLAALLGLAGTSAFAQHTPKAEAPHPAPAASAPAASVDPVTGTLVDEAPPVPAKDAKIEHLVSEDSQVRIEETRVRGATTKIVVHSKLTGDSYEIQPRDNRLPPEQDKAAGMRTFSWGF
jgi:hypothetical protein